MLESQISFFVVMLGAMLIPFLGRRFRLPGAALEIVYGIVLFNLFVRQRPEWFLLLKEMGFIYLMFIAGMELDLTMIRKSGKSFWYVLVALLSFTLTPLAFVALGQSFYLGLTVAMISAGIVIPVLKESGLNKTPLGQQVIGIALTGELLSILVLTLVDAYHKHGLTILAVLELARLTLLFAGAFLVLKALYILVWWHPERVSRLMESDDPIEEGIRTVVTVAFAGGLLASLAGAEPILGSFIVGMIFSYVFKSKGRFEEKINAIGFGFLIPFFFIGVGAEFPLGLLLSAETVRTAAVLTLAVFASNLSPLLLARPLGVTLLEATGMALLLSAPLSMIVVSGTIGMKMGLVSPTTSGALILTALLASILYPSLFRVLARRFAGDAASSSPPPA
ncbi:sodium:proton antiporter [Geotalea uraniireducens]|uniref:Sodium:proton antiporter n=1 Tax=Geotalea uraniireducens TaxID=351604 RepID=A0ABN6VYA9_9BACT|nr:cation:proton antiporter [Geotalea uraniireducens]BDV44216.1 sodium:proton antiporter [Geotalea uraniireducens]